MQREIHQTAYDTQKDIEKNEEIIVGVNEFTIDEEVEPELLRVDEELEKNQIASTRQARETRDDERVTAVLRELRQAAETRENLMPIIVKAVKEYATVGEIANVLREEFGEYTAM